MADDFDSSSQDGMDENDDEEIEENGQGKPLLGFMFGNVDNSGDLDVDYLDKDAKEHLSALADQLDPPLADIDLAGNLPQTPPNVINQGYGDKAEDAVDYGDIDEEYDGPDTENANEEENLLPKKYFSFEASLEALTSRPSVFDDEDYDETSEMEQDLANYTTGEPSEFYVNASIGNINQELESHDGLQQYEGLDTYLQKPQEEGPPILKGSTPLPILFVEDGKSILKFSKIFYNHDHLRKGGRRNQQPSIPKDRYKSVNVSYIVEEDEEVFFRSSSHSLLQNKQACAVQNCISENSGANLDFSMTVKDGHQQKDPFISAEPMKYDCSGLSWEWHSFSCADFHPINLQNWEDAIIWGDSPDESKNNHVRYENSVSLEPFGSKDSSGAKTNSLSNNLFHPQLLRLESRPEVDTSNSVNNRRENISKEQNRNGLAKHYKELALQNKEMMDGSWVHKIIWEEADIPIERPKPIFDLQDDQMHFEVDSEYARNHLQHSTAMVSNCPSKSSKEDSSELPRHGNQDIWLSISNDKYYSDRKTSLQLKSHSRNCSAYGVEVFHSRPALELQTMKLKLRNKDIANFHRPKALWYPHDNEIAIKELGKLPTQGPIKVIMKSLGGKGSKLLVDAQETLSSVKAKASKLLDFNALETVKIFYLGKELEDQKSLAAQTVMPNSLLHLVRSKIHLWPRAQRVPGKKKSRRPPAAFNKKSDLSVKDGHVFLMEYCEERPLLLSNAGMGARLCTYYRKGSSDDQGGSLIHNISSSLGHLISLDPADKSPFLGDLKPGSIQLSLETCMYRAPIFPHKVLLTDYLLIRSSKGKLSLRRIDKISTVGQQEPLMEVLTPGSKNLQTYSLNRILVHMCREFHAAEKRHSTPYICENELQTQFPYLSRANFLRSIKKYALSEKKQKQTIWVKQQTFHLWSEDVLRKMVSPELVCAYESMQTGLYRLKHLGITKIHSTNIYSAMSQLPDEVKALVAASHIERELQTAPWRLSKNFVACTSQGKENIGRLEIKGDYDPSGRGLGFSYAWAPRKAPVSSAVVKNKTDVKLTSLTMHAMGEILTKFNVPEEDFAQKDRWQRLSMIKKLSSEQAASSGKVDPTMFSKYIRPLSFVQLQQQAREKCQEIWDRQVQSLSAKSDDEYESDSEENNDIDSFIDDLEKSLDVEMCEDGKEGTSDFKLHKTDAVKAKEEIEDEASEAAELCRLLMDDEKYERKKETKLIVEEAGVTPKLKLKVVSHITDQLTKEKRLSKKVTCGACGQFGHMKTNMRCPKYGEDSETQPESTDMDSPGGMSSWLNSSEGEKSSLNTKVLRVKFKCSSADKPVIEASHCSDNLVIPDSDDMQAESCKSTITIRPPTDPRRAQVNYHKPSIELLPSKETDRKQPQRKIIIKCSSNEQDGRRKEESDAHKEMILVEQERLDEEERQKAKKKKKKKKVEFRDEHKYDQRTRFSNRVIEREQSGKKRFAIDLERHEAECKPPLKRHRVGRGLAGLANILEGIVDQLKEQYELFMYPMSKRDAPDYKDLIKRPMYLSTIRDRVRRLEYKSRVEFRCDVRQIADNARTYHSIRNPLVVHVAYELLQFCDHLLNENDDVLNEAEDGIETWDS